MRKRLRFFAVEFSSALALARVRPDDGAAAADMPPPPVVAWGKTAPQLEGLVAERVSLYLAGVKRGLAPAAPTQVYIKGLGWRGGGGAVGDLFLAFAFQKWRPGQLKSKLGMNRE